MSFISHNTQRLGKKLKSIKGNGEKIKVIEVLDETKEAQTIVKYIQKLTSEGTRHKDIAVLYRINALSRTLEEVFLKSGIAYKMVGGVKFYERAEIKDIISYFKSCSKQ